MKFNNEQRCHGAMDVIVFRWIFQLICGQGGWYNLNKTINLFSLCCCYCRCCFCYWFSFQKIGTISMCSVWKFSVGSTQSALTVLSNILRFTGTRFVILLKIHRSPIILLNQFSNVCKNCLFMSLECVLQSIFLYICMAMQKPRNKSQTH